MSTVDDDARVKIPRTAKGERPQNFSDPAIDTLLGIVMSLTAEVSVLRDRIRTLEQLLTRQGALTPGAIESADLSPEEFDARARDRADFLERVLRAVRSELDELSSGRLARPVEDIIGDLAARKF